nr:putative reverse transcriptase domain-containing protein [Tanacetum cinerariifolium]
GFYYSKNSISKSDKKSAEDLAANHLSQLENLDLRKLTKAKIKDLFPEERLMTGSYEGVSPEMRRHKSSNNVTAAHQEGIMVLPQPQGKSSKPGSTCKISFMMHVDWAIPSSNGNKYILVAINYVSKWVKAQAFPASDARNVVNFLKILFVRFGISKALISDRDNYQMGRAMK